MLFPMAMWGQKIIKNDIDKFTKQRQIEVGQKDIVRTHKFGGPNYTLFLGLRYTEGKWVIPAVIVTNSVEKYNEESGISLLLDNGETINLITNYTGISGPDNPDGLRGYYGFDTSFSLTDAELESLRLHPITDIRISSLDANYDFVIKKNKQNLIQKMISLIDEILAK